MYSLHRHRPAIWNAWTEAKFNLSQKPNQHSRKWERDQQDQQPQTEKRGENQ